MQVNRITIDFDKDYDLDSFHARCAKLKRDGWEIIDIKWLTPLRVWVVAIKYS